MDGYLAREGKKGGEEKGEIISTPGGMK